MQIDLYSRLNDSIVAIEKVGGWLAKSGFFRTDRVEQGQTLMLMCWSLKISPFQLLRTHHIIDNQLSKKSLAALAEFREKGGKHRWLNIGDQGDEAIGEFTFEDNTITVRFTMDDARKQGLVRANSGWVKTPSNMLRARVISNAIGMLCPEIFAGSDPTVEFQATPAPATIDLNEYQQLNVESPPAQDEPTLLAPLPEPRPVPAPAPATPTRAATLDTPALAAVSPKKVLTLEPEVPGTTPSSPPLNPAANLVAGPDHEQTVPSLEPPTSESQAPEPTMPVTRVTEAQTNPLFYRVPDKDVSQMEVIFKGNYPPVAQWLEREKWLPTPNAGMDLATEDGAVAYLVKNLPKLSEKRAKRILNQKMNFMRAVQEMNPS